MSEDVTKLPKWAQERIATLEMRLDEQIKKNVAIESGDTRVTYREGLDEPTYIPDYVTIRFALANGGAIDVNLDNLYAKGTAIRVASSGGGPISIVPQAANSIQVSAPK